MTRPTQSRLPGVSVRRKVGSVERAAAADLKLLRDLGVVPGGMTAVETAYRRVACQVDTAHDEQDRYGVINATRELRNVREALGATTTPDEDSTLATMLEAVARQLEEA
jgi:hypothetical protein